MTERHHGNDPGGPVSLLAAVFDESPIATLRTAVRGDRVGVILEANPAAQRLLGRSGLAGRELSDLIVSDSALAVGAQPTHHIVSVRDGPGRGLRWLDVTVAALSPLASPEGGPAALVVLRDVTQGRAEYLRLDRAARRDPLTGLVNRDELVRGLAALDPASAGPVVAVIFCDLDRFKRVNDSRGHQVGDEVLVAVSRRIRAAIRPQDTLARLGGDEFVVACPGLAEAPDARAIAERVRATLAQPVSAGGHTLRITASVGVATSPADEVDPVRLLGAADAAMYREKQEGRARMGRPPRQAPSRWRRWLGRAKV